MGTGGACGMLISHAETHVIVLDLLQHWTHKVYPIAGVNDKDQIMKCNNVTQNKTNSKTSLEKSTL